MAETDLTVDLEDAELADDIELMRRIVAGDSDAFRDFYRRHSPVAFALCVRILRNRADAEDVLANVFFELWEKSGRFDPSKGTPYTYLMVLTRSRAIDEVRRRQRGTFASASGTAFEESPDPTITAPSSEPEPADRLEASELARQIRKLFAELDAKQRQALELAYYEGLSHSQIAERMATPLGTIKSSIRTAMAKLRSALKNTYDDCDE